MARSLTEALCWAFRDFSRDVCFHNASLGNVPSETYMEIPINKDTFEVPLFAFSSFSKAVAYNDVPESIVVMLNTYHRTPGYKTLDRNIRDSLLERYDTSRLVIVPAKDGNSTTNYFGTQGAIFDTDFTPIMICSWVVERYQESNYDEETHCDRYITSYNLARPIFRIDPEVFKSKSDSMERLLSGRMLNTLLDISVSPPNPLPSRITCSGRSYSAKVEIDKSPFIIHSPEVPSISTSNKALLQLAIDHIDEIIKCQ